MLTDSHAHLNDSRLDYKKIVENMRLDQVGRIITVGYDVASSMKNLKIALESSAIFATAGIHPSDSLKARETDLMTIEQLCGQNKVVALGEIGLDYHYPNIDKKRQQWFFVEQLKIAKKVGLPVVIHLRDAYEDMRRLVEENIDCFKHSAVMHCFSGSAEEAKFYVSKGFYISFAGPITFKNANFADVIRVVPKDKILIETDCPYLAPEPFRGTTNQPKYLKYTCQKVAEILGLSYDETAKITSANTVSLFRKILM